MMPKSKFFLISLCFQIILLTLFPLVKVVRAETNRTDGFMIEADQVVGSGMFATIVKQETSTNDGKPMLRIQYNSATIYGMRLTKQLDSPSGPISITLRAKGPVFVKGMIVDTTAISFQGACIKASETIPEIGMKNVVMVAHYMNTGESNINELVLNTISEKSNGSQPKTIKILQDLSKLPVNQVTKEIGNITSGHLPLMCENGAGDSDDSSTTTDPIKKVMGVGKNPLDPVKKPLEPILNPLDPVKKPLEPILNPLDPVKKPLEPILKPLPLDPVKKPLEPILKPHEPVTKQLEPVLKPLDPITKSLDPEPVEQTFPSVCIRIRDATGVMTKELALYVIDEAIHKKLTLPNVCQSDPSLTKLLQNWNDSLLKSLGLVDLIGLKLEDPIQSLQKMREKVTKEKDGAIIFSP